MVQGVSMCYVFLRRCIPIINYVKTATYENVINVISRNTCFYVPDGRLFFIEPLPGESFHRL